MARLTHSLTTLLLVAALTACGGDDGGGAGMAGSGAGDGGTGGTAGEGGSGGTAGEGGVGGDEDSGVGGVGGETDAGVDASAGDGGVGGEADASVDSSMPIECDPGTQDNDMDDVCSAACTDSVCDNGVCDDSSGTATCECDEGWAGETCDVCALGYRNAIVIINTPPVCTLNTPSTTNMRMWLDAADAASFTFSAGKIIEWRSHAPGGVGEVADNGTDSTRPVRTRPDADGRRVVRFDGADDRLQGTLDLRSETYSIFVVAKAAATKAGDQFFMHGLGQTNITRNLRLRTTNNAGSLLVRHSIPGGFDEADLTPTDTSALSVVEAHRSGTLIGHALTAQRGADVESIVTAQAAFDEPFNVFLGRRGESVLGGLEGDIAEVIVFVPAIPAVNRQAVRDYLNAKWKL